MEDREIPADRLQYSSPARLGRHLALVSMAMAAVLFLFASLSSASLRTSQIFVFIAVGFAAVLIPFSLAIYAGGRAWYDASSGRERAAVFVASAISVTLPPSIYAVFLVAGATAPFQLILFLGPVSPQLVLLAVTIVRVRTRVLASWIPLILSAATFVTPVVLWIDVLMSSGFGTLRDFSERASAGNILLAYLSPFIATYALTGIVDLLVSWVSRRNGIDRMPMGRASHERA